MRLDEMLKGLSEEWDVAYDALYRPFKVKLIAEDAEVMCRPLEEDELERMPVEAPAVMVTVPQVKKTVKGILFLTEYLDGSRRTMKAAVLKRSGEILLSERRVQGSCGRNYPEGHFDTIDD